MKLFILIIFSFIKIHASDQIKGLEFCKESKYPPLHVVVNPARWNDKINVNIPWLASIMYPFKVDEKKKTLLKKVISKFRPEIISISGIMKSNLKNSVDSKILKYSFGLWFDFNRITHVFILTPLHEAHFYYHKCLAIIIGSQWILSSYIPFECLLKVPFYRMARIVAFGEEKGIILRRVIEIHRRCRKSYQQEDEDGPECSSNYNHKENSWNYTEEYPGIVLYRIQPEFSFKSKDVLPMCLNENKIRHEGVVVGLRGYITPQLGHTHMIPKEFCETKKKFRNNTICATILYNKCNFYESGTPMMKYTKNGNISLMGLFIHREDGIKCSGLEFMEIKQFRDWIIDTASRQENCGKRPHYNGGNNDRYIVRGFDAKEGQFPWTVSLNRDYIKIINYRQCVGAIVDYHWVITAKHCVEEFDTSSIFYNFDKLLIHGGGINIKEQPNVHKISQIRTINSDEIPCRGHINCNTKADIALIRVTTSFNHSSGKNEYQRICLPFIGIESITFIPPKKIALINGWGVTLDGMPKILQWTRLRINDCVSPKKDAICTQHSHIGNSYDNNIICEGDTGASLMVHREDTDQWYTVAIHKGRTEKQMKDMRRQVSEELSSNKCGLKAISYMYAVEKFQRFIYWTLRY